MKKFLKSNFFYLFLFVFTGCVSTEDLVVVSDEVQQMKASQKSMEERVDEIYKSVTDVDSQTDKSEKELRSGYADLVAEEEIIRNRMNAYDGELERAFFIIESLNKKLASMESKIALLDTRIKDVEKYLDFEKSVKPQAKEGAEKKEEKAEAPSTGFNLEKAGADEIYEKAKKYFDSGEVDKALKYFTRIIEKFEKSDKADNAAFWIGEIYYKNGEFQRAIVEYQNVIEKYSTGNKVASAYLKQGLAFNKLGSKKNAKVIFEVLIEKFPGSNEALIAKRKLSSF